MKKTLSNKSVFPCALVMLAGIVSFAGEVDTDFLKVQVAERIYGNLTASTNAMNLFYSFPQATNSVADESGNGNVGTVTGAAWTNEGPWTFYGMPPGCFVFDGTSNYIQAADSASLDIRGAFTISVWVKGGTTNSVGALVCKHNDAYDRAYMLLHHNDDRVMCQISSDGTGGHLYEFKTQIAHDFTGDWHHVAATWSGVANTGGVIYVDGVSQSLITQSAGFSGANIYNSSQPLRIGGKSNGGWLFTGKIDEVRIYNRALSSTEIGVIYENGKEVSLEVTGRALLRELMPQGDIGMGNYTNGP